MRQPPGPTRATSLQELYQLMAAEYNIVKARVNPITLLRDAPQTACGLTRVCEKFVNRVTTTRDPTVDNELMARILLIPCTYLSTQKAFADTSKAVTFDTIANATNWVLEEAVAGPDRDNLVRALVRAGSAMISSLCEQPLTVILDVADQLQASFLLERSFFLVCLHPVIILPRETDLLKRLLSGVCRLGDAHARAWASAGQARAVGLMSPCLVHVCKRLLRATLHPSLPRLHTGNLLKILVNAQVSRAGRAELFMPMSLTRALDIPDAAHLSDVVRCMAFAPDGQHAETACLLAYSVLRVWPLLGERVCLDGPRLACLCGTLRILCLLGLCRQRTQRGDLMSLEGHQPKEDLLVELLTIATENIEFSLTFRLPLLVRLQAESGLFAAVESVLRGVSGHPSVDSDSDVPTHMVIELVLSLMCAMLCDHSDPVTYDFRPCISIAATVRKMADTRDPSLIAESLATTRFCRKLIMALQAWPVEAAGRDQQRLIGIVASIMTNACSGQIVFKEWNDFMLPGPVKSVVDGLLEGEAFALFPNRVVQGRAWSTFVHMECPNLLPGCGHWMCSEADGCWESSLPTLLCAGCRRVRYCSTACQKAAWVDGHEGVCERLHLRLAVV